MEVTLGLIGVGTITESHLEAIREYPDYRIVGVSRRTRELAEDTASLLGCKAFTDYRRLLDIRPDVVLISLPHRLHCPVTLEAVEAGCHVLVEKPMARNLEECNRMLKAAAGKGRHVIVTESASFLPGAVATGKKFAAGMLGEFLAGSILNERFYFHDTRPPWFLDPEASGGGMFCNVGVHRLAAARACLPGCTPVSVSASVSTVPDHPVEACTSALVRYSSSGAMLYEEIGYFPRPDWYNGGSHFAFTEGIVSWDNAAWKMMARSGKTFEEPLPPQKTAYAPVYENMLRAMRGEEYSPKAEGNAMDVAIVQAAYRSSRQQRAIDLRSRQWRVAGL